MKNKYLDKLVFSFLLFMVLNECKKENIQNQNFDPGPLVLTPYHISAYVDSVFIDAAYSYMPPDTLHSGYSPLNNYFTIWRDTSSNKLLTEGWIITGTYINLDQIIYPKTFWLPTQISNNIEFLYQHRGGGLTPSRYDSTLFSLTLASFDHDTLSGYFQGELHYWPSYTFPDSIVHVTNGTFKILMTRY